MSGKTIGYIRVSSFDQCPHRQLEGKELDEKFIEYASAKNINRPKLQEMLLFCRKGDMILVHSIDRLARNMRDLQDLVEKVISKDVCIHFIKENLVFDKSTVSSPISQLLFQMMGAFAEFERSLIIERQREGIELAKKKGKYAGRTPCLNADQMIEAKKMNDLGIPKVKIARHFKISRFSVYKYLRK